MKIVKIQAPTLKLALEKVKKQLGNDAVVLNTEKINITPDSFYYQITAAIDYDNSLTNKKSGKETPISNISHNEIFNLFSEIKRLKEEVISLKTTVEKNSLNQNISDLQKKINLLYRDSLLLKLADNNEILLMLVEEFTSKGFDEDFILEKIEELKALNEKKFRSSLKSYDKLKKYFLKFLENFLNACINKSKEKHIQVIWGPPGTGKTTTVAKLASKKIMENKKVAIISFDNYKVSGAEQLRRFAHILNVPFFQISDSEKIPQYLAELYNYDFIFFDTPGVSTNNYELIRELHSFRIEFPENNIEHFLALESDDHFENLSYFEKFFNETFYPSSLIITKFDQIINYGNLIKYLLNSKLGVKYITNGQNVPDDILEPEPCTLLQLQ